MYDLHSRFDTSDVVSTPWSPFHEASDLELDHVLDQLAEDEARLPS